MDSSKTVFTQASMRICFSHVTEVGFDEPEPRLFLTPPLAPAAAAPASA